MNFHRKIGKRLRHFDLANTSFSNVKSINFSFQKFENTNPMSLSVIHKFSMKSSRILFKRLWSTNVFGFTLILWIIGSYPKLLMYSSSNLFFFAITYLKYLISFLKLKSMVWISSLVCLDDCFGEIGFVETVMFSDLWSSIAFGD